MNRADNSNRELTLFDADCAYEPLRALEVAGREFARRHDVYTLDSYAPALRVSAGEFGQLSHSKMRQCDD